MSATISGGRPCVDRRATPQEIEVGRKLAHELRDRYHVRGILAVSAEAGCITELRCAMPYCFASARDHFVPHGLPLGPWMPTHEHYPLAKRFKGKREITNAVLAHRRCNNVGYKIEELRERLETLPSARGGPLRQEAIDAAIADHVEQRRSAAGRYPRNSGSRKRAIALARQTHESLG